MATTQSGWQPQIEHTTIAVRLGAEKQKFAISLCAPIGCCVPYATAERQAAQVKRVLEESADWPIPSYSGREDAGRAAQQAIQLSVRVSDKMRAAIPPGGDMQDLKAHLSKMFPDEAERTEARRLLELSARIHKKGVGAQ